ncbi:MAG: S-adenosyl-l-methionine hydroxide adenosyltransferase family protein [bacterium]
MAAAAPSPILALLTDFGTRDGYAAAMKGAALCVNPRLRFVDISHEIAPQSILEGALVLQSVFDYFPEGALFAAVVDPGVGGDRAILAARVRGRVVIAPDNGLLSPLLDAGPVEAIHNVTAAKFRRDRVHPTFHGRDIIAPAAAHVSLGVRVEDLGETVTAYRRLEAPRPTRIDRGVAGAVIHVDRFGNIVTNIAEEDVVRAGGARARVVLARCTIEGVARTYSEGSREFVAVVGSWGYLEIALRGGHAALALDVAIGDAVHVMRPLEGSAP